MINNPDPPPPLPKRPTAWYGCRPDTLDARDATFKPKGVRLPAEASVRQWLPPVMNQGPLGCCTGHGTTGAYRTLFKKAGLPDIPLSRLQNYFDARLIENCVGEDAGAEIRDNIKAAAVNGIAREDLWPYIVERFKDTPPQDVYTNALQFQALKYERVRVSRSGLMHALAEGFPVIIGITVFDSFESDEVARTGHVPLPDLDLEASVGGHCMLAVEYKKLRTKKDRVVFGVMNSWDTDWGDAGFCYFEDGYLNSPKFGADYWVIREAELAQ